MSRSSNSGESPAKVNDFGEYEKLGDIDFALTRPGVYMPEIDPMPRDEWICSTNESGALSIKKEKVTFSAGAIHLFVEIASNAADNADKTRRDASSIKIGKIEAEVGDTTVTIRNSGRPIEIKFREEYGMYNPDLIFGEFRSSSTYKVTERKTGGLNGLGAKLTNVFSRTFKVKVLDPIRHLSYEGVWMNNMREHPAPIVKDYNKKESLVEITYELDFPRFSAEKYDIEALNLMKRYLISVSATSKIPVIFNGEEFDYSNPYDFCKLIFTEDVVNKAYVYYTWEGDTAPKKKNKIDWNKNIPEMELFYFDTPHDSESIAFVNSIPTSTGVHLKKIYKEFADVIIPEFKNTGEFKLTVKDIQNHVSVYFSGRLANPKFEGNMKDKLSKPALKLKLPDDTYKKIKSEGWRLLDCLKQEIMNKEQEILRETDGQGKNMVVRDKKCNEAILAGTVESPKCVFNIAEGDSAANYLKKRIAKVGGNTYNAIMRIRGKLLNTMKANATQIRDNKEIALIKTAINLQEGLDYTDPVNRKTLKYGFINIVTDADDDGKHIASLIINFLQNRFPSLIYNGMVGYLRLPVVKVSYKNEIVFRFFSNQSFDEWFTSLTENQKKKYSKGIAYFKGLASSSDKNVADDLEFSPVVQIIQDADIDDSLKMAFDPKMSNKRKEWINKWRNSVGVEDCEIVSLEKPRTDYTRIRAEQTASSYFRNQWVDYSVSSFLRGIPGIDGLKDSQRKLIYFAYNFFKNPDTAEFERGEFLANQLAAMSRYHHGAKNLEETLLRMCLNYVGTNNIPLFEFDGQLGDRSTGPKGMSAARYVGVKLATITHLIFCRDLIEMVPNQYDEGKMIEPEWLPSIIPIALVNGTRGVSTAYSNFIPNYNPIEIIDWLINKCRKLVCGDVNPYYRGFRGKLFLKKILLPNSDSTRSFTMDGEASSSIEEDDGKLVEVDPEFDFKNDINIPRENLSLISKGNFTTKLITKRKSFRVDDPPVYEVTVTELPIGMWVDNYSAICDIFKEKKILEDFDDDFNAETDTVRHVLRGYTVKLGEKGEEKLGIVRVLPLTIMNLINTDRYVKHFESQYEILEEFYKKMIPIFAKFRESKLSDISARLESDRNRINFIRLVLDRKISIWVEGKKKNTPRPEAEIIAEMEMNGLRDCLSTFRRTKFSDVTEEEIENLQNHAQELEEEYATLERSTPQSLWVERLMSLKNFIGDDY